MESGLINSIFRRNEKAHDEAFTEKEKPFEDRVNASYENKNLSEFNDAILDARKLDKPFNELMAMGEETLEELYGSDITDLAVALGVKKQLEDIERLKTKG